VMVLTCPPTQSRNRQALLFLGGTAIRTVLWNYTTEFMWGEHQKCLYPVSIASIPSVFKVILAQNTDDRDIEDCLFEAPKPIQMDFREAIYPPTCGDFELPETSVTLTNASQVRHQRNQRFVPTHLRQHT
jgi:hypothetical protein